MPAMRAPLARNGKNRPAASRGVCHDAERVMRRFLDGAPFCMTGYAAASSKNARFGESKGEFHAASHENLFSVFKTRFSLCLVSGHDAPVGEGARTGQ